MRRQTHRGAYDAADEEAKVNAMLRFAQSEDFPLIIGFLEEQSWTGQNPFDAAGYDALRAAAIGGRQDIVEILKIEINKAKTWTPKPTAVPKRQRRPKP
jgi:hypothetical protein